MRRDPGQVAKLEYRGAEGEPDFGVHLRLPAAGEDLDEVVELGGVAQYAENDLVSERGVAGIEVARLLEQRVARVAALRDFAEDLEGSFAGGRHVSLIVSHSYNEALELEKAILRKVGEAIARFRMIRPGDRVAVGVSGGKDSLTLLEALLRLRERAPVDFTVCAFTVEQGKFLRPFGPMGEWLRARGVAWTYYRDQASFDLLEEQPDHGCDLCSRYRRRAVYEIGKEMGANVIALGHTADDLCESFLRNAMFTGKVAALPPVTYSKEKDFRLIRPLVYVTEDLTAAFAAASGAPVIPCGCSQRTGTVRRSLRDILTELERDHPRLRQTLVAAIGNLDPSRLLDERFLDLEDGRAPTSREPFPILTES